jgi:hypothetical protein
MHRSPDYRSIAAAEYAPSRDGCSRRHGRERGGGGSLLSVRKKYPQTSLQELALLGNGAMIRTVPPEVTEGGAEACTRMGYG